MTAKLTPKAMMKLVILRDAYCILISYLRRGLRLSLVPSMFDLQLTVCCLFYFSAFATSLKNLTQAIELIVTFILFSSFWVWTLSTFHMLWRP